MEDITTTADTKSERARIVLVEDHTIIRQGLKALFASEPCFEVVGEAADGREAIDCVKKLSPDIVLMDLSMPRMDGMEAIRQIKAICPDTRILVLTVHKNEEYIHATFEAGADGYALKYVSNDDLVSAIKTVLGGVPYLSPAISQVVLEGYLLGKKQRKAVPSWETLTPREREILKLIAEGYKNKDIADLLCLSVKTVATHRANIMSKLDLHSGAALTAYAVQRGLAEP